MLYIKASKILKEFGKWKVCGQDVYRSDVKKNFTGKGLGINEHTEVTKQQLERAIVKLQLLLVPAVLDLPKAYEADKEIKELEGKLLRQLGYEMGAKFISKEFRNIINYAEYMMNVDYTRYGVNVKSYNLHAVLRALVDDRHLGLQGQDELLMILKEAAYGEIEKIRVSEDCNRKVSVTEALNILVRAMGKAVEQYDQTITYEDTKEIVKILDKLRLDIIRVIEREAFRQGNYSTVLE